MKREDETLHINKMAKGSKDSFKVIYLYYHPKIYHFLLSLLKNEDEAQDIAQDIFYKIWINRKSLVTVNDLAKYLYTMAKNSVYELYRKSLLELHFQETAVIEEEITYINPEKDLCAKELNELIELSLSKMSEQRRLIFNMSRKEGLSNQEISDKLNISKRTVENSISLTLTDLRKVIKTAILFFMC